MDPGILKKAAEEFERDGCAIIPDFISESEVLELREEMSRIIAEANHSEDPMAVFSTSEDSQHRQSTYFLDSADKMSFFYEEGAFDKDGKLTAAATDLALNKVGHALHTLNPVFRRISTSDKFLAILKEIGYSDPKIVQSMYIFKQARIGAEVAPHIDATFLYIEPISNLLGLWIPLHDATLDNGCLHFVPGSHKVNKVPYRMVRTHQKEGPLTKFTGEKPEQDHSKYVPAPVTKGSLVLIHGLVWHKSHPNTSENPRHAYTFHVVDMKGTTWSPDNWLQPASGDFLPMYPA